MLENTNVFVSMPVEKKNPKQPSLSKVKQKFSNHFFTFFYWEKLTQLMLIYLVKTIPKLYKCFFRFPKYLCAWFDEEASVDWSFLLRYINFYQFINSKIRKTKGSRKTKRARACQESPWTCQKSPRTRQKSSRTRQKSPWTKEAISRTRP